MGFGMRENVYKWFPLTALIILDTLLKISKAQFLLMKNGGEKLTGL